MYTKGKWEIAKENGIRIIGTKERVILEMTEGESLGCTLSEANARRIVQCVNSHDGLVEACKVAVLALTHDPINPKDIAFIEKQLAEAEKEG